LPDLAAWRRLAATATSGTICLVHDLRAFFRANPQVLVLLIVCLVLGLGTFLAVVFGLITAGSSRSTGEPSGLIAALSVMLGR
jgi:hypothetical protein